MQGEEQVLARERVARALHEELRRRDPRQVGLASLLELPGGVKRIAEEGEAVRALSRRHHLRGDPPAHRPAAVDDALRARRLPGERGRGAGRGLEDGRRVGPARALLGVGEVVEAGGAPGGGEGLGEGQEHGVVPVAPGPVAEHDEGRSPAVERGARLGAGDRSSCIAPEHTPNRRPRGPGWYTRRAASPAGSRTCTSPGTASARSPSTSRRIRSTSTCPGGTRRPSPTSSSAGASAAGSSSSPARWAPARRRSRATSSRSSGPDTHTAFVLYPALTADELLRTVLDDLHVKPEGDLEEEPRGRAPPLPARGPGGQPQRRAPDRRGAGPLGGGPRADPPHLEPRDRHREAHPDRPHGPVGAARPARPPRAAPARAEGDRALPPLAPVAGRDRRVRPTPRRRGRGRGQGGLHERRPRRRPPLLRRRPPPREPRLRPGAPRRVREGLADDHAPAWCARPRRRWRGTGPRRPSAGTTASLRPGSPWRSPCSPSPWPRGWRRPRRPPPRAPRWSADAHAAPDADSPAAAQRRGWTRSSGRHRERRHSPPRPRGSRPPGAEARSRARRCARTSSSCAPSTSRPCSRCSTRLAATPASSPSSASTSARRSWPPATRPQIEAPLSQIDALWTRDAVVWWPEPAGMRTDRGRREAWARQALSGLGHAEPEMATAVSRFQESAGLVPDGLLGPRTRMALFALSPGSRVRLSASGGRP